MTNELRFFEQDGKGALGVLATESSLPAKVLFLSRTDCFVLMSMPSEVLECYKYQDLITSTKERPAVPVWSFGVGEFILEMATHQISKYISSSPQTFSVLDLIRFPHRLFIQLRVGRPAPGRTQFDLCNGRWRD